MKRFNQKGFTLVELIVTFALLSIALSMICSFLIASLHFFENTRIRADKQAQLRVIMLGLKEELKTAADDTTFKLTNNADSDSGTITAPDEKRAIYFDDTDQTLKYKDKSGTRIAFLDLNLSDFDIIFSRVSGNQNLVHVKLITGDIELESDLALLNTSSGIYNASSNTFTGVILTPAK